MAKGYIIVEFPEDCSHCMFDESPRCMADEMDRDLPDNCDKPDWCPIKPLRSGQQKFEPTAKLPTVTYPSTLRPAREITYVLN